MTTGTLETIARDGRQSMPGAQRVTLLDLVDRLLQGGIVVQGDVTLAVADIDLVNLTLRLILSAVDAAEHGAHGSNAGRAG